MFTSLSRNMSYMKVGFSKYPLFFFGIPYCMVITLLSSSISLFSSNYSSFVYVLLLLPMLYFWRKDKAESVKESRPVNHSRYTLKFTAHQVEKISSALPTQDLDLLENIIFPMLIVYNGIISAYSASSEDLLSVSFDRVVKSINDLTLSPILFTQQGQRKRDRAILLFSFLKVIQEEYLRFVGNQPLEARPDPYLLIKRAPYKLYSSLGPESYRLLDFQRLIISEVSAQSLNHDILPFLGQTTSVENIEKKYVKEKSEDVPLGIAISASATNEVIEEHSQGEQPETCLETTRKEFGDWLCSKLKSNDKRFKINQGGLIFSNSLEFGESTLFINSDALDKYCSVKGANPQDVEDALSNETLYELEHSDTNEKLLMVNPIQFEQEVLAAVTINEVKHENTI